MADLKATDIAYVFLGNELGARSENPNCYIDNRVQYNEIAKEPSFNLGLRRIKEGMERHNVALMCAEKDPITCHRTILVCRALRDTAISIFHIREDGVLETNDQTELRLMNKLGIKPDMFRDEKICIEDAYNTQSERIAYVRTHRVTAVSE
jgi:uncharacterized protein (DUF488 family)